MKRILQCATEIESVLSAILKKAADKMADKPKSCLPHKKYLSGKNHLGTIGAGGGGRTRTMSPSTDFESVSSANSNTPANIEHSNYNANEAQNQV